MKNLITLLAIVICTLCGIETTAQNYYYAVSIGDTVQLTVTNANGTIQWQQTDDTLGTWANISGATTSPYIHLTESSATGKKFYRAEITNPTVCATGSWYSSKIKHKIITATTDLQIGDFYGGGFVFYNNAGSGLIATPSDLGTAQWGCGGTQISGTSTVIDSGLANTNSIVAFHDGLPNYYGNPTQCIATNDGSVAAKICADYTDGIYSDWFLPSKDELNLLYTNLHLNELGGFSSGYYWSSSEYDAQLTWLQIFSSGSQVYSYKDYLFNVRGVRAFSPPPSSSVQDRLTGGETPKQIFDSGVPLDSLYGKTYQGGLICYLNTTDGTGMVAAPADQGSVLQWGCSSQLMTGADGLTIGTGNQNTIDIELGCTTPNTAADVCANLILNSYSDWFLPSKDELHALYTNLKLNGLGGFGNGDYWSSSEYGLSTAWLEGFASGTQYDYLKGNTFLVRAVRAFSPPPIPNCGTVTDYDGNIYNTVTIGSQCWLRENLKTIHYADGSLMIDGTAVGSITGNDSTKYYFDVDDNPINTVTYGKLYTWAAVMNEAVSSTTNPSEVQGVCPTGWHIPSDAEWIQLIDYLGGSSVAGGKLKETGFVHWSSPNTGADNSSGFTGLPGASRNSNGIFNTIGHDGDWWSATEYSATQSFQYYLNYSFQNVYRYNDNKAFGFSVRCVKD